MAAHILNEPRYRVLDKITPFDERDNIQARQELDPGTQEWKQYYATHPEWENKDLELRNLPGIGLVGNPLDLPFLLEEAGLAIQLGREDAVDGAVQPVRQTIDPSRAAEKIKGFARHLGADLVRIGPLNPAHVYTHIGKTKFYPERKRGTPIDLLHRHAISMAVGIDPGLIKTGPVLSEIVEVVRVYVKLAMISNAIAGYIRALGYPARAHNLFNYQVLCVPVAIDAGMGELGRHGLMITRELGSSLKIAVVTTDMPLCHDSPVDIGVQEFCKDCRICAETCPSGAISLGQQTADRGVLKWKIKPEACFKVFGETGTDCGVCVASCPWTKKRTWFHRLATEIAMRKHRAGWWMSRAEKIVYGKFRPKAVPDWFEEPEPIWKKYKRLG